jgi:hypothetical protein
MFEFSRAERRAECYHVRACAFGDRRLDGSLASTMSDVQLSF